MSLRVPHEHDPWPGRLRLPTSDVRLCVELVDAALARQGDLRAATPSRIAVSEARRLIPDSPARLLHALARGDVLLVVLPNPIPPVSSAPANTGALRDLADDTPLPVDDAAPKDDEPLHGIEVLVVDARGEPQTGILYELTLPDGGVRTGRTGADGHLRLGALTQTGDCRITFPEIASSPGAAA